MKYLFIITGRRWFQKTYGNTYHTATIEVHNMEGDTIFTGKVEESYGYGNMFLQNATKILFDAGYLEGMEQGGMETLWRYCERTGNPRPIINTIDVAREKDL